MRTPIEEKQKKLLILQNAMINWLEMRVNDLQSYDFYVGASERQSKLNSELAALESSDNGEPRGNLENG
jgi:hypothetical protein